MFDHLHILMNLKESGIKTGCRRVPENVHASKKIKPWYFSEVREYQNKKLNTIPVSIFREETGKSYIRNTFLGPFKSPPPKKKNVAT